MVGVIVQDRDAPASRHLVRGRDRDVIHVAEAAAVVWPRMVARRSDQGDRRVTVAHRSPSRLEHGAGREGRDGERAFVDRGLGIEESLVEIPKEIDVGSPMDPS
jgi:hypothetical protein